MLVLEPQEGQCPAVPQELRNLTGQMVTGTSSLGIAVAVERGSSFLANVVAARIGGTGVFGTYALMVATANSVAAYAGVGIGQTATRFSCTYNPGTPEYRRLLKLLAIFVLCSVFIAITVMVFAARPMATYLMKNPQLYSLLRLGSLSAGATLLMECIRGVLIGERRYKLMLTTASIFGCSILIVLPLASRVSAQLMIIAQSLCLLLAAGCALFLLTRRLLTAAPSVTQQADPPSLRQFAGFGFTQLLQTFCMNTSGLWVTSMLVRSDSTLVQLGFFAVASQIRNMTAMAPGLLSQSSFPLLTEEGAMHYGGSNTVLTRSTYLAVLLAFSSAGVAMLALPFALPLFYGKAFAAAEAAAILGIGTSLVHMSAAPASSRLTIVSLKATGAVTTIWAILVALAAWRTSPHMDAMTAMEIYFGAHSVSALLVVMALHQARSLPFATVGLTASYLVASWALVMLALWRSHLPAFNIAGTVGMCMVLLAMFAALVYLGIHKRWIPRRAVITRLREVLAAS